MAHHIIPPKTYYVVFAILLVLLVLTVVAAGIEHALVNIVTAITIASVKALLIVLYFMHVRYSSSLSRVFATGGIIWLVIMLALTLSDYTTRGWIFEAPNYDPPTIRSDAFPRVSP